MYLEVNFYDNDFSNQMTEALKRLWSWIDNNKPAVAYKNMQDIFIGLHDAQSLEPLLHRLFILECMAASVEFNTRGLYGKHVDWEKKQNCLTSMIYFCIIRLILRKYLSSSFMTASHRQLVMIMANV